MWHAEIAYYRDRLPDYAASLDAAEALFDAQEALAAEFSGRQPSLALLMVAAQRLAPVFSAGTDLAHAFEQAGGVAPPAAADTLAWAAGMACSTADGGDELAAFVSALLVPFYHSYHDPTPVEPAILTAQCPRCGGPPLLTRYRQEDGTRLIACAFCRSEWACPRLGCPTCGNTRAESLRYFYAEGDRGHRVDLCDRCGAYLRASDERVMGRTVVPAVEHVITEHLDLLALEAGYRPAGLAHPIA